jgi:hypothetical protein
VWWFLWRFCLRVVFFFLFFHLPWGY